MNINRATLFPELDEFAKNFECLIAIKKAISIDADNIFDVLIIIDRALSKLNCCDYYYFVEM